MTHIGVLESNLSGSGFEGLEIMKRLGARVTFFTRDLARYLEVPGGPDYFDRFVDRIVHCETNVLDELMPHVLEAQSEEPFDAFLTLAEYDVVVAAQVAVHLDLPTVGVDGVFTARNKARMRRRCSEHGVASPAYRAVRTPAEAVHAVSEIGLPCVVKPADETSSADVRLVRSAREASEHVALILSRRENTRGQSRHDEIMVEEYLRGPEVSVEVLSDGDRHVVLGVTDKSLAGAGYFVEMAHSFPSILPATTVEACGDLARQALRAVGFDKGMSHVEIKVTDSGPVLVEINPRPAGGKITYLVDRALGISSLELAIRQYLGESLPRTVVGTGTSRGAAIRYLSAPPGVITSITGAEAARAMAGVDEVVLKVTPGATVRPLRRNGDRLGHVLAVASTAGLAAREAEAAAREIDIRTAAERAPVVVDDLTALVGRTPMLRLRLDEVLGRPCGRAEVLVKLEMFNPWSSSKDRTALAMLEAAEARGQLTPGAGTVIEATSGNTGISLAAMAAARGYRCIIVLPDNATTERIAVLRTLGAEVVTTANTDGYQGCVDEAARIHRITPGSWNCLQHENPDNPAAHEQTTGPEIWEATQGRVDVLVCAVGTGGTLSGTARFLRKHNPDVRVVAVEPAGSPLLSGGRPGRHRIPGLNGGFIAPTTDRELIDEVVAVTDDDASAATAALARRAGLLVGISAGAVAHAVGVIANDPRVDDARIVAILPDSGERYLSMIGAQEKAGVAVGSGALT